MLFLLPAYLSEYTPRDYFAPIISEYITNTNFFLVENEKTARKIIRYFCPDKKQSDLQLFLLDKYSTNADWQEAQKLLKDGQDFGLLSEAGLPCIADPGNIVVRWCHDYNIKVIPVNGPSSIILGLISSGFNGQQFTFHGYLPIEKSERKRKILDLEKTAVQTGFTQIFMETPYRNMAMIEDLCNTLPGNASLCIAANINNPEREFIKTKKIAAWKKEIPQLHKMPAIFLIGK